MKNKYDVLIVLGKNVGYLGSRKAIQKSKNYLSRKSEVNVLAAGILFNQKIASKIIFSGGKTAGKNIPSEAFAMKKFLINKFSNISGKNIILEEVSMDTIQNVIETKKIIEKNKFKNIAVLSTSKHLPRSIMLFRKFGLNPNYFASDEVLKKSDLKLYNLYKNEFTKTEEILEKIVYIIQKTPIISSIGNSLTEKRRSI